MSATIDENATVSMIGLEITGTDGGGIILLPKQASAPSNPTDDNIIIYNDDENLAWNARGFRSTIDTSALTTDRQVSFPDSDFEVASASDPRFDSPQIKIVKTSSAGVGEFTSVAAAIASITDAEVTRPYIVSVAPGVYEEPAMVVPSYVSIIGPTAPDVVVIRPESALATPLFTLSAHARLSSIALSGLGSGVGVRSAASDIYIAHVRATSFVNPFDVGAGSCVMLNCGVGAPFTTAFSLDGASAAALSMTAVTIVGDGTGCALAVSGQFARMYGVALRMSGLETGLQIDDAGQAIVLNSTFDECDIAIHARNIGDAPTITINNATISGAGQAALVEHPGTVGVITGSMPVSAVTIDPASPLTLSIVDPVDGGVAIVGDLLYSRFAGGVLTEHGDLLSDCSPLGTYTGGEIEISTGLSVDVAGGTGYTTVGSYPTHQLIKLSWAPTNLVLAANTVNYIYVQANTVTSALSLPNPITTLILGRVGTLASEIEFVDPQIFSAYHPTIASVLNFRNIFGARFSGGSIVSANPARELAISAGQYWFNNNEITTSGLSSPAQFFAYYHSGGSFVRASATVVDNAQYDNGTGLVAIPATKYTKHSLYTVGSGAAERYFLVYGRDIFDTVDAATSGAAPTPPNYFSEGIVIIAGLIVLSDGDLETVDLRPMVGSGMSGGAGAAASNHSDLLGLTNDDHTQYLLTNGTRAMSGALAMGGNAVTGASTFNGITITAHASRHLPNGADALTTGAPSANLGGASANSTGIANSFARSDHSHAIDQTTFNIATMGGTLPVASGGTGATTLTAGRFLVGAGTSAVATTKVVPAGDVVGLTDLQQLTNKDFEDSTVFFVDATDDTRRVGFEIAGTTSTTLTLASAPTANRTLTFPDATDTLVGRATTDTLTNKTLTAPVISTISNSGTLTLPTGAQTLVGRSTTDSLTNKSLVDASTSIVDSVDATKRITFDAGGTTGSALTLASAQTANRTLTFPDATDTLVGRATTDTLTNKSLVDASTFVVDSVDVTKRIAFNAGGTTSTSMTITTAQTVNRVLTLPDATDTLVGRATTDTLTNKTLTAPTISTITNGGVITLPAGPETLVGLSTIDLLSNKSFISESTAFVDVFDPTKRIEFDAGGTTETKTTFSAFQSANRVLTIPDASGTIVLRTTTDTLTNKSLTDSNCQFVDGDDSSKMIGFSAVGSGNLTRTTIASTSTSNRVLTLPDATDTLLARNTTDTLTNKKLVDSSCSIVDATDSTIRLVVDVTGTTSTATTLRTTQTADRTVTLPDVTDTLLARTTTDTLTNKSLVDASTDIVDSVDATKRIVFNAGGTTSTTTTLIAAQTANRSVTFPDATDTLVGRATTDTLTNKTLTAPVISTISNDGVVTIPTGAQTLVGRTTTDTLTNKSLVDASTSIVDSVDATKQIRFDAGGTTSTATTLIASQTANRSVTFPDATDTLVGRTTTDTMTNKTFSDTSVRFTDNTTQTKFLRFDLSAAQFDTILRAASTANRLIIFPDASDTLVGLATTDTLTNKKLVDNTCSIVDVSDSTKSMTFNVGGTTGTSTALATVQTTNQILTFPDATDVLVGKATTDLLTNKSFADSSTRFVDAVDVTVAVAIDAAGSTSTLGTLRFTQTVDSVYTIPPTAASFVMTEGAQTVNGAKTLSGALVASSTVHFPAVTGAPGGTPLAVIINPSTGQLGSQTAATITKATTLYTPTLNAGATITTLTGRANASATQITVNVMRTGDIVSLLVAQFGVTAMSGSPTVLTIGTLAATYRPTFSQMIPVTMYNATNSYANAFIDITAAGVMSLSLVTFTAFTATFGFFRDVTVNYYIV